MDHSTSDSAGQRVFYIPELLANIVASVNRRSDLATIARSSRLLNGASIPRLWSGDMFPKHSLDYLLDLLPPGLVKIDSGMKRFSRDPEAEDWTRFNHYSIHLQSLKMGYGTRRGMNEFSDLLPFFDNRFPRLRTLTMSWHVVTQNNSWWSILGSSLSDLVIENVPMYSLSEPDVSIIPELLQKIAERCPSIKKLDLPTWRESRIDLPVAEVMNSTLSSLSTLQNLKVFHLHMNQWIPEEVVKALFTLPLLERISLDRIQLSPGAITHSFPQQRLQYLSLHGTTTSIQQCLDSIHYFDEMLNVTLTLLDNDISTFSIQPLAQCTRLEHLTIKFPAITKPLPWSQIKPILGCPNIGSFLLDVNTTLRGFDDMALEELGTSWRNLWEISIFESGAGNSHHEPSATLVGLGLLIRLCRELIWIRLTVSTRLATWTPTSLRLLKEMDEGSFRGFTHSPCFLDLHYTRLSSSEPKSEDSSEFLTPERVAHIFHQVCPGSQPYYLRHSWRRVYEQSKAWKAVVKCWEDILESGSRSGFEARLWNDLDDSYLAQMFWLQ